MGQAEVWKILAEEAAPLFVHVSKFRRIPLTEADALI